MTKAIQQIMLGTVTKNEKQAAESLKGLRQPDMMVLN